jgi:hypothetical protein
MSIRFGTLALAAIILAANSARAKAPTPTITPQQAAASWCAAWSMANPGERRALIQRFWSADGVYSDPNATTDPGVDGLDEAIVKFQHDFPGVRFRCGAPQVHHAAMRHNWLAINPDGSVKWRGTEFSELAADGRIRRVTSFFGEAPSVAP